VTGRSQNENKLSCHERKRNVLSRLWRRWRSLRARQCFAQAGEKMRGVILWKGWKLSRQYQRCAKNSLRW
jgi:hypothetical protein